MDSVRAAKPLFSDGLNLANLVVSSDILCNSWAAISAQIDGNHQSQSPSSSETVKIQEFEHPEYKIIAFVTPLVAASHLQEEADLVPSSSSEVSEFQFLRSQDSPSFAINKAAISLFNALRDSKLSPLKTQVAKSSKSIPHIITGDYLGGSIASLFTLWLLRTLDSATKNRPLCITFGSPLIGDDGFQQAISQYSTWNSCFLHVAHMDDSFPRLFLLSTAEQSLYRPFGTFLLCSDSGGACFEAPDTIIELLTLMSQERNGGTADSQNFNYKSVIECLERRLICKNHSAFSVLDADSFKAGINAQVAAIGLMQIQNMDSDSLWMPEKDILKRKNQALDPAKELNKMKVYLAYFEWYKKKCEDNDHSPGYYDSFKNKMFKRDHKVVKFKTELEMYWKAVVEEAEKRPHLPEAPMRFRWLFAGTNYRRMVEPLHIAEYYKWGNRSYISKGRSKHFKLLEQWLDEHQKKPQNSVPNNSKMKIMSSITEDSCFWTHVEEARITCRLLNSGGSNSAEIKNLVEFEKYVMGLLKNYAVTPDIFLESSSYMQWWREYEDVLSKQLMGTSHNSELTRFMDGEYHHYKSGKLVFHMTDE
ncbi:senescence-associated carboxylesterase 101 isoform X2 [Eucalyptus grandis]|uniref:senescence-associated carboxylesterase 101 isoform X2 n=1 Tax=Eucalyptus grandis TaxID=71139 RepID=UPI000525E91D|nr:senescence-associated carboxylesterase 101 isoform X2 [Eucalyptus grandis]